MDFLTLNIDYGMTLSVTILGDKSYPFLLWLMIPHKQSANIRHTFLEVLYNKHLSNGRNVVENAFEILKSNLRFLALKGFGEHIQEACYTFRFNAT
jgi:hypothetical protein